jgi:hypothetical protein
MNNVNSKKICQNVLDPLEVRLYCNDLLYCYSTLSGSLITCTIYVDLKKIHLGLPTHIVHSKIILILEVYHSTYYLDPEGIHNALALHLLS